MFTTVAGLSPLSVSLVVCCLLCASISERRPKRSGAKRTNTFIVWISNLSAMPFDLKQRRYATIRKPTRRLRRRTCEIVPITLLNNSTYDPPARVPKNDGARRRRTKNSAHAPQQHTMVFMLLAHCKQPTALGLAAAATAFGLRWSEQQQQTATTTTTEPRVAL